jgi:hypothetical protein
MIVTKILSLKKHEKAMMKQPNDCDIDILDGSAFLLTRRDDGRAAIFHKDLLSPSSVLSVCSKYR